jgi:hypothetical protein
MRKKLVFVIALFLFTAQTSVIYALSLQTFEWQFEMRRIGVEASDLAGSTSAVWTNAIALRTPLRFGEGPFFLVPGLSLTTLYYYYNTDTDQPAVTDVEWRELTALVPQLDTALRWVFFENEKGTYSFESGLSLSLPIPVKSWDSGGNSGKILPAIYSGGGFILPMAALQGAWPIFQGHFFLFRLSTHLPVYRAWDESGLPMSDGLQLGFSIGLLY